MMMVEKVARAMAGSNWVPFYPKLHGSSVNQLAAQRMWMAKARAALTALLEPSAAVIDKGIIALDDCVDSDFSSNADGERDYYTTIRSDAAALTFRAMIQAALDEKEGV